MDIKINSKNILNSRPRKRVLFVITQSEMGGASTIIYRLIKAIDKQKFEIGLASGPDGNYELLNKLDSEPIEKFRLKNLRRENLLADLKAIFEIRKLIKKYKPDTLFLNSSKAGFIGSLATVFPSKLKTENYKLKIIYRIGGWTFNDPWPDWKRKIYIFLERLSAKWKDIIIVNNARDFKQAYDLNIKPKEKIELIYNGLDINRIEFLEKDEAKIRLFEKISEKPSNFLRADFIVGTLANFYPAKGLEHLIEAVNILNNTHKIENTVFVIIGDGPERKNLKLKIKNSELENKVFLTGQLPDAYKYLKAFEIFVLPSFKEGFPSVLLEAMAAKVPSIATAVGAVPEIIETGKNGFMVPPKNPQALAEAISNLVSEPTSKEKFSIEGHQTVLFKFGLDKTIKQIEDLF